MTTSSSSLFAFFLCDRNVDELNHYLKETIIPIVCYVLEHDHCDHIHVNFDCLHFIRFVCSTDDVCVVPYQYKLFVIFIWLYIDPQYASYIMQGEGEYKINYIMNELHLIIDAWREGRSFPHLSWPWSEGGPSPSIIKNTENSVDQMVYYIVNCFLLL